MMKVKCPTCQSAFSSKEWNLKTSDSLKPETRYRVEEFAGSPDYRFVCPNCSVIELGDNLILERDEGLIKHYELKPKYVQYLLPIEKAEEIAEDLIFKKTGMSVEVEIGFDDETGTAYLTLEEESYEALSEKQADLVYEYLFHPDEWHLNANIVFADIFGEGFFTAVGFESSNDELMIEITVQV